MRFSDDHDEPRAISRFGERGALAASALMLTLDGVPLLYNGMEVGDATESGAPALFEKLPVFWKTEERRPQFPVFYKKMIELRRTHEALRRGETEWLGNSDPSQVVTLVRRAGRDAILIAINFSNRQFKGSVQLKDVEGFNPVDVVEVMAPRGEPRVETSMLPELKLEGFGFRVYSRNR